MSLQLVSAQAITTAGNTTPLSLDNHAMGTSLLAQVNVTATSGTAPSLTVNVQQSPDGVGWTTTDTFPAITNVGVRNLAVEVRSEFARLSWTVTGTTPSFTTTTALWA